MVRTVIDGLLLLAILTGGAIAWRSSVEGDGLRRELNELLPRAGELPITDSTRAHVRAMDTRDPMQFAWRVYVPPNYTVNLRVGRPSSFGESSSSTSASGREFIARVRFREVENGELKLYTQFDGSGTLMTLCDANAARFLRGRWNKLSVKQLGAAEVATVAADKQAVLLRITLPADLVSEAQSTLPGDTQKQLNPVVFEWLLGKPSGAR
jgi:hypothetical protein